MPLGAYIRQKLLGGDERPRRRHRKPLRDDLTLAKLLGELGSARLANNLNQLAKAANAGSLPVTPETEQALKAACDEQKLGLTGQPRAVVFHEKDGRRHAHVVCSRIDANKMKAINLPHFKLKLRDVSRQLYLENGWQMPRGLINSKERDPKNFSREEWQQAKRAGQDAKALKGMFQECWAASDSAKAFGQALQARGFTLARGDRRGHVAVDYRGEVYAVAKWAGLKAKDVRARLGDGKELPSVEQAKAHTASRTTETLQRYIAKANNVYKRQADALDARRKQMVERQRKERAAMDAGQQRRWDREAAERSKRLNKGIRGLWDRLTGQHRKTIRQNELEALQCLRRDRREKDELIERHQDERQPLHQQAKELKQAHVRDVMELQRDIAGYLRLGTFERPEVREQFREASREPDKAPSRDRGPRREL